MNKNLKRDQRLEVAKRWISEYKGNKWISSYRKRYGISSECAIQELLLLQVPLTKEEIINGRKGARARSRKAKEKALRIARSEKKRNKKTGSIKIDVPWQDETYFYIAGYTDWGFPYGITWEENERMNNDYSLFRTLPPEDSKEEEIYPWE
ncbi:hypothetical protein [Cohnella silvisoli]|uniref:HNH endonuclease n=1 Tax=Cohnella silvisoli TaxID=2873699 RepID=A0ABV1KMZ2_9BACL|nr:hypothetical protein [Cohnella silvisoli]MCD9020203.1 hypothetical protein [Cohnella silvisoli]